MKRPWRWTPWVLALALAGWAALAADLRYTVRKGDSLSEIADKYGVPAGEIARLNGLKDVDAIREGQSLKIPPRTKTSGAPAPGGTQKVVVESGDTLGSIAHDHGVSVDALARHNRLGDPDELQPGQVLAIPPAGAEPPSKVVRHSLAPEVKTQLDKIRVVPSKWRYVVIHHSATRSGSTRGMEQYHRRKRHMENGLAYHFVIGNGRGMPDGKVEIGSRWRRQIKGGHLASDALNQKSIGICLVGNFENERPTAAQMRSLYALVNYLQVRCRPPSDAVKLHRQINTKPTACPGRLFPARALEDNT